MELDGQFVKNVQTPATTSSFTVDITVNGTLQQFNQHVVTITKLVEPIQGEVALSGITLPEEGRSATGVWPLTKSRIYVLQAKLYRLG